MENKKTESLRLNLGGGYHKIDGFKTVDIRKETNPDYVADFEKKKCLKAIKTNSVDEMVISHVLEHIHNYEQLMLEIYRVCKNGATIEIATPYWSHQSAVEDPTHVRYFTERSMMYLDKRTTGSDGVAISIPYNFQTMAVNLVAESDYKNLEPGDLLLKAKKFLNIIREVRFKIQVIK